VHFGLGYLYWESHQYDAARREFRSELAIDPNHPQALAYLGDIEMKQENLDDAVSLLGKAVSLKSDLRLAYVDLGAVLMERKQYKEAIKALQHAVQLDPTQPDAYYRLGRIYKAIGNTAESEKEFAKVRELHATADSLASKMSAAPPPLPK
jgi:predicted Zn-dependent protease